MNGSCQVNERSILWQEYKNIFSIYNSKPWICVGNLNGILLHNEKSRSSFLPQKSTENFKDCLQECELINIGFRGLIFTWQNNKTFEILDRVIANLHRLNVYEKAHIDHL